MDVLRKCSTCLRSSELVLSSDSNFLRNEECLMEINCNKFAANFLVPDEALEEDIRYFHTHGTKAISEIAHRYSVSREVVLRRLIDNGAISKEYYETKAAEWNKKYLRREKTTGGGNFYLTHLSYLGEGYTKVAFENYYRGVEFQVGVS